MLKITERIAITDDSVADDFIELDFDSRKRGRLRTHSRQGVDIGLFLERGRSLQHHDWLKAENGDLFQVVAAAEDVFTASTSEPLQFARVCYHLGNRHVPLQIGNNWLRFQPDHVLRELCQHYGLTITPEKAPFQPEGGAYGKHTQANNNHSATLHSHTYNH